MGFLEWFNPREFMNTSEEWHAFCEGFAEVFCFWRERHQLEGELLKALHREHHYYTFGRVLGFACLVLFGVGILKLLRRSVMNGPREYQSNYEFKCADCEKPIKPRTKYYIRQKHIMVRGQKVLDLQRVHVECPKDGA